MADNNNLVQHIIKTIIPEITPDELAQLAESAVLRDVMVQAIDTLINQHQQLKIDADSLLIRKKALSVFIQPYTLPIQYWFNLKSQDQLSMSLTNSNQSNNMTFNSDKSSNSICVPRFQVANMKVGEYYATPIEIKAVAEHIDIIIDQVTITNANLNLKYNKLTQSIEGTPQQAGSFSLGIHWYVPGYEATVSQIELIVNPDPNSLWKDLPAPASDPYFKSSLDYKFIQTEQFKLAAASRRGRSHAHIGSFRDDDFYLDSLSNGWNIAIVADGAGSAANSRKGSQLVVNTIGNFIKAQLCHDQQADLLADVSDWGQAAMQRVGLTFKTWFRDAAILAIKTIEEEANSAANPVKSYSTTVLVAVTLKVADELFCATFSVGDGAIAAYSLTGNIRLLGSVDSGEYAGQTRFLDNMVMRDSDFYNRIRIGKWRGVSHLLLMTDGISDPKFETDFQLNNTEQWHQFIGEIAPMLADDTDPALALLEWMKFASPGNHDDRTLIVLW